MNQTELYTSSQAREKLGGMSSSNFKTLVDTGRIRKVTPPNKKHGFYMKEDVDKIAEAMQQFVEIYKITHAEGKPELVLAQNESDIKATIKIDQQYFGDQIHSLEKRMYWFNMSPLGDWILKQDGVIIGFFSMQAIKQEAVDRLFIHRKGNPKTQPDDMEPLIPGKPLQAYISNIAIAIQPRPLLTKAHGMLLLANLESIFIYLAKQGIDIQTIWAKSSTVPGIKLCRDFGFTELGYINNEQIGFTLEVENSELPMIQRYRQARKEIKEEQKLRSLA